MARRNDERPHLDREAKARIGKALLKAMPVTDEPLPQAQAELIEKLRSAERQRKR
jgi:hypothetical protein